MPFIGRPNLAMKKAIFRDTLLFPDFLEVTLCPALLTTYLPNACFHMEFIVFFQSRYNFDCNFSFLGLFLEFFGWRSTAWSNYGHFKNKRIEKLQHSPIISKKNLRDRFGAPTEQAIWPTSGNWFSDKSMPCNRSSLSVSSGMESKFKFKSKFKFNSRW